jgi:plastocyanin
MSFKIGLLSLALVSALTVACAPPPPPASAKPAAAATQAVEVKALDTLKFDPATITVKKGTPVHLTLVNNGALEHDWVVDNLDGKKIQVHTTPKSNATADFTPEAAGTKEYYCSIPGHREAGMKGTLTIQ